MVITSSIKFEFICEGQSCRDCGVRYMNNDMCAYVYAYVYDKSPVMAD